MISKILTAIFAFAAILSTAQEGCQVLTPAIEGEYIGECKKGLAHGRGKSIGTDTYEGQFKKGFPHGKGTYTFESGDYYIGELRKGQLDGEGEMYIISTRQDTVISGIWVENNYAGPKIEKPKVIMKVNVDDGSFRRNGDGNRLVIGIFKNGMANSDLTQLIIAGSSGGQYNMGQKTVLENITFPFECKITYTTWNKLHTVQYAAIFQFEIQQAGDWSLDLRN